MPCSISQTPSGVNGAARSIAPGRTIVGDHALGQTVPAEGGDELLPDRLGPLVGASRKYHREARVIVEHSQRMKPACVQRHMALEVHLPQLVRLRPLEAGEGRLAATMRAQFDPIPLQDRRHRRGRRNSFLPEILQPPGDLAATPGWMFATYRKHCLLRDCSAARAAADATAPKAPSSRPS